MIALNRGWVALSLVLILAVALTVASCGNFAPALILLAARPRLCASPCSMCDGDGTVPDGVDERGRARVKTCPNCGGHGEVG